MSVAIYDDPFGLIPLLSLIFMLWCAYIYYLETALKNNIFGFNEKFYKQLKGTAMSTKLAPAYVNIFIGKLEHTILSYSSLKPSFYKRYINNILIFWPIRSQLKKFLLYMNSIHPSIKFTSKYNNNKSTFLYYVCIEFNSNEAI